MVRTKINIQNFECILMTPIQHRQFLIINAGAAIFNQFNDLELSQRKVYLNLIYTCCMLVAGSIFL